MISLIVIITAPHNRMEWSSIGAILIMTITAKIVSAMVSSLAPNSVALFVMRAIVPSTISLIPQMAYEI